MKAATATAATATAAALDQRHIAELKEAFHYLDHDGDGVIDEKDLDELLPSSGELIGGLAGKLNFPMFLSIITDMMRESEQLSVRLQRAFEELDDGGTGCVRTEVLEEAVPGISDQIESYGSTMRYRQLLADNSIVLRSTDNLSASRNKI